MTVPTTGRPGERRISSATSSPSSSWPRASDSTSPTRRTSTCTNNRRSLTNHKCLVGLGHDEYWSEVMRTAADQAVDAGVNIAFLGANAIYRHIRLEDSPLGPNRHQVCYKTDFMEEDPLWGVNPAEVTSDWPTGPMPRPEQTVIGAEYRDARGRTPPMSIVNPGHWVFAGTGVTMNQSLPGVIFGEYDFYDR